MENEVFEVRDDPTGPSRKKCGGPCVQAIINGAPVIERISFLEVRSRESKRAIIDLAPGSSRDCEIRNPPNDDFDGEQDEIVNHSKRHQPAQVKNESDRSERHEEGVTSGLNQFLLPRVIARAVERKEIDERCELVIRQ